MAVCPICGKEVDKPAGMLKNHMFTIKGYNCDQCHNSFKVTTLTKRKMIY